jgi:hypothetical protein
MSKTPKDSSNQLLSLLGITHAMAAKAKGAAERLHEAADSQAQQHADAAEKLGNRIRRQGVGTDEEQEKTYCQLHMARHRMEQARELSARDMERMPDVEAHGDKLEKGVSGGVGADGPETGSGACTVQETPSGSRFEDAGEWVPPDVPVSTDGELLTLNGANDRDKQAEMVEAMATGKWKWHLPLLRVGTQLVTGSHRYTAARKAGIPVASIPTKSLDDVFRDNGLSLEGAWRNVATPYNGWITNLDFALSQLSEDIRTEWGIDLG